MLDEHGGVVKSSFALGLNFVRQPNDEMTYFDVPAGYYYGLDSDLSDVDSFTCTNGYLADSHELLVFPDGGYCILGQTRTTTDLSHQVVGGSANAVAVGNVIQTFDDSGNLIFEWRGVDHYNVTDALGVDFRQSTIDFEHANSIDIDSEGNYLLSNRNLCEVTKIDGQTGAILWRFGGNHNQFTLLNDTLGMSYQHDARFLPDGYLLLFDNGNLHATQESRAVEYRLDTTAKSATLSWQFRHDPPVFAMVAGSAQRLPNGNTFIGWGQTSMGPLMPSPAITEVTNDGTVVSEMNLGLGLSSYRARKYTDAAAPQMGVSTSKTPATGLHLDLIASGSSYAVSFSMDTPTPASVSLYDIMGRQVARLFDGMASSSPRDIQIPTSTLSVGVYYCLMTSADGSVVRRMAVAP